MRLQTLEGTEHLREQSTDGLNLILRLGASWVAIAYNSIWFTSHGSPFRILEESHDLNVF